jgi:hypothetical protein
MRDKIFSPAVAALVLLGGFADLVRGGIHLAPILLTLAYLVLIPGAILGSRALRGEPGEHPYCAAAVAGLGVFGLYLLTLAPSTAMWDTSEYLAAAWTFGLPHPPGNPMFVILGRTIALLPIAPTVAMRINLLAAAASAVSAAIWFLVVARAVRPWAPDRRVTWLIGGLGALIGATAFTVWNQSVVNEKVYTVSLVGMAVCSWLMLRWSENPESPRADRYLVLVAYLAGLGYANHMAGMLPVPAAAVLVLWRRPATLLRWRVLLACIAALVLGLTPFATQPVRAAYQPALNEGEPTACRSGFQWSCTLSEGTWKAFSYNLNREQYGKPDLSIRQAPFGAQVGMWWLYFKWQWFRDSAGAQPVVQGVLAALFLVLGLAGAREHRRHDPVGFAFFGPLVATLTVVLIYYLNFKYGASQSPGLDVPREVRDRDYFYLWSFSAWGPWVALGLAGVWRALSGDAMRRAAIAAPVLAIGVLPLGLNWRDASRAGDYTTVAFARDLLNSVEPYGILITGGDNDTFPLWYAQEVEGIRRDVTVGVLSLMNTDWFARGLARRPVQPYDAAKGPAAYRDGTWPMPTTPPLRLTLDEVDALPEVQPVQQQVAFQHGTINAVIDPRRLLQIQGVPVLERADLIFFRMVADNWPQRPIHISRTTGDYADRMGLGDLVASQGLARKLVGPPGDSTKLVMVEGSGWFDVERSLALWKEFRGPQALVDFGRWVDRPSVSTAFAYLLAGSELAEVLRSRGDTTGTAVMRQVESVARAVSLDNLLQPVGPPPPREP